LQTGRGDVLANAVIQAFIVHRLHLRGQEE
jgi:hypothetical protein